MGHMRVSGGFVDMWTKHFFGPKIVLDQKLFWTKIFFTQIFVTQNLLKPEYVMTSYIMMSHVIMLS